ncbi:MAG: SpoIIE family protein phosphatase [Xanthobacteraceae bacterium]|nr:SpoIIE family protein phosphatase [Xanthobacteraceae bacterium]
MDPVRLRAAAAGALIAVSAGLVAASPAFDWLRGFSIDFLTMLRWQAFGNPHGPASSPAVVVAIDEETFKTPPFEGSPSSTWTPEIGRVLTAIIDGGARVVGFDIIFPTSIEQSAVRFGDDTLGARLRGFDRDYLRALAIGARAGKVVLGQVQHKDDPVLPTPGQRAAVGHGRNIRALNVYTDPDGVVRRVPLAFSVDGESVPSMSAELAARATGAPASTKVRTAGAVADTITLNFAGGADDIPTFSLADLRACAEKEDKDFFRRHFDGKVVLIGTLLDVEDRKITSKRFATAPEGARAERCALATPAAGQAFARATISGVYVQATAVNNLMRGDALTELGRTGTGIVSFVLAALAVAAAILLGPAAAVIAFLGLAAAWIAAAVVAFRDALALPLVEPLLTSLAALGATVGYRLVVADRIMAAQLAEKRARDAEMASAAAIQRAMLPDAQQENFAEGRLDVFAQMIPAKEVGGDLYDIVKLDENRVVITIGDVCGKGVPASLFMAITQTVMRLSVRSGEDLQAEIGAANDLLVANNRETMFTTLFCGVLDVTTGAMTYCNCGHNPPLVLRRGESTFEQLRNCGPALAIMDDISYSPRSITLAPGDVLFLYTDGVTEAEDPQSQMFETARLEQALIETRDKPARGVVEHVVKRVNEFANGAPQSDDITCIAVVRGGG